MVLEAIYNGQVYPLEQVVPDNPQYKTECAQAADLMDVLKDKLSKEAYDKVEELRAHLSTAQCIECEENFKFGFAMGVLMMNEVYRCPYFPGKS